MIEATTTPRWLAPAHPLLARLCGRPPASRPTVTGHVLSARVVEQADADGTPLYAAEIRFLYNVHARTREGRWTSPLRSERTSAETMTRRFYPGAKTVVAYEPADPTRADLRLR